MSSLHNDGVDEQVNEVCITTSDGVSESSISREFTTLSGHNLESSTGPSPCTDKFPGEYDFQVELSETINDRKSWRYSSKLRKVFVDINKIVLFQFKLNKNSSRSISNLRVRALLVYTSPDHSHLPVNRCMLHAFESDPNYLAHVQKNVCNCSEVRLAGHVLTSNDAAAAYEFAASSGRHSVVVGLRPPQAGSDATFIGYQFGCKTSCEGGMSRRQVNLVFTLETQFGEVLGRSSMLVKVCSCPKRDRDREESDYSSIHPDSSNERLAAVKRKHDDSQEEDDDLQPESSVHSQTPLSQYHLFMSLFNQVEKMSEWIRQSVEFQKKLLEESQQSSKEIINAIEEINSKINENSFQETNEQEINSSDE
ncbi:cellular tumor antigen p53 [Nilaparvata lugens]|uniref:cellular tumor antigen p53 n=1 Tax=Nilaparvata lugens TaxID=108931 RepID=UPI00193DCD5D|nr:cellular tumor antigen p53 [Nilaparvata lugens]